MTTLRELKASIDMVAALRPDLLDTEVFSKDDPAIYIGTCHVQTVDHKIPDIGLTAAEVVVV